MVKPRKFHRRPRAHSGRTSTQSTISSTLELPRIGPPGRKTYHISYSLALAGDKNYTGQMTSDIVASLLSMASTNTASGNSVNMLPIIDSVRLERVSMYVQDTSTTTGNPITVTGTFPVTAVSNLTFGSRLVQQTARILGSAGSARIDMVPDKKSPQGNIIAGQSSSNVWFSYDINAGGSITSVACVFDVWVSGSIPTSYGSGGTSTTFPFPAGPLAAPVGAAAGKVYAMAPFASLGSLNTPSGGYANNFLPLI